MNELETQPALTKRQREIYEFLKEKIVNRGYGPTVREIGSQFGIRSPNGVMCHLNALEKKGLIKREANKSRAINLTSEPQKRMALRYAGQIAAGSPLEAVEQNEKVDFSSLFADENQYCLHVSGKSLDGAQIAVDDHVIIRKQKRCKNGDLALVVADDGSPELKQYYQQTNRVRLNALDGKTAPTYSKNVKVLGVVVGVIRQRMFQRFSILLLFGLAGCSLAVMTGKMLTGDPLTVCPFTQRTGVDLAKHKKKVLVYCSFPEAARADYSSVSANIVESVALQLKREGVEIVKPGEVTAWIGDRGGIVDDRDELAEAFQPDYIIHIDLDEFTHRSDNSPNMYQGRALGHIYAYRVVKRKDMVSAEEEFGSDFKSVITPQRVQSWLDKNPDWSRADEIGAEFKTTYVIHIELEDYQLYEKGNQDLYRGRAEVNVSVWKMDKEAGEGEVIYRNTLTSRFPLAIGRPTSEITYSRFKKAYLTRLSEEIGRLFYEHYNGADIQDAT
eukprot:g8451.t1